MEPPSKKTKSSSDDADNYETADQLYQSAVDALMSPLHQATSKEEIQKSAERRVKTVADMRHYWNKILKAHGQEQQPLSYSQKLIHITGTKGKGSTACMAEAVLRQHGYSTGLFTSPHLITIRERIRWNGQPIHPNIFGRVYWKIRKALEVDDDDDHASDLPPTLPGYFRMLTLMGLYTFLYELVNGSAAAAVDVVILEVGMGGRYDATNFLDPSCFANQVVCGVTLLDLDHTRILGDTLEKIAWEKGGIFAVDKASKTVSKRPTDYNKSDPDAQKPNVEEDTSASSSGKTFYILDSNTSGVLEMMASCARIEGQGGTLEKVDASGILLREGLKGDQLGLAGDHQYGNATLAVALCRAVTGNNDVSVTSPLTQKALVHASWPARCQTYQPSDGTQFLYLLDGAHTPQSLAATVQWFCAKLKKIYSDPETRPNTMPILVFNTSHERNPVELLQIIVQMMLPKVQFDSESTSAIFPLVYFAASDSSRPSPVQKSTAQELLNEQGIEMKESLLSVEKSPTTWQDTLQVVYRHLVHSYDLGYPSEKELIQANMTSAQVILDLKERFKSNKESTRPTPVLVTGSLYLVGSFLNALNWQEESSPPS
jgi:folylpolyglutamate synthase